MEVGAIYPQTDLGGDPEAVRRIGAEVEALGYTHLLAYDHVLGAVHEDRDPPLWGPYHEHDPFHDPFVLSAYLAGRHERLGFVSGVLVLPQRQTALVAKQATDVALLSGNRFRLGVGVGWNHVEYSALGMDFSTRGARLEEQVQLLRRLWTEPVVDFEGQFDTIPRAASIPRPSKLIPIWMGGWVDAAMQRAARLADGFIFAADVETVTSQWTRVQQLLGEAGRPVEGFGAEAMIAGLQTPVECADFAERWAELGGTHASIGTMGVGLDSLEGHLDFYRAAMAEVRARIPLPNGDRPEEGRL
jgi:probable F420-dependent oxidoreductase